MTRRAHFYFDLKGDLDSIGELCGGFRWRCGADWLHATRRAPSI